MVGRNNSVHGEERSRETNFRIGQFIGEYRNGEWLALAAPYIRQWGTCSTHDSVECSAAVVQGDALDVLIQTHLQNTRASSLRTVPTGPSCLPRNEGAHSVNAERFPYSTGPVETGPQCTGHWPGFCPHQIHHSPEPLCSRQPPPTKRMGVSAALNQALMSGPSLHQPMESLLINPSMIFLIPLTALLPHHLHAFLGCLGPCVHRLELP